MNLQVRLNGVPKQSQRQLTLKAKMSYCSGKGAMGSLEGTAEIVPNADGVAIVSISGMKLPSRIATYSAIIFWSIIDDATGEKIQDLTMTQHKIFVTLDKPLDQCTLPFSDRTNVITDKRLQAAIDACSLLSDNPDMYAVAQAIQEWLPTKLPWQKYLPRAKSANQLWALVDSKNWMNPPWMINCAEYACIHELMLHTLGIDAEYRHIFATEESFWRQNGAARFQSASNPQGKRGEFNIVDKFNTNFDYVLVLDFPGDENKGGGLNDGEGAVRVGENIYTEGKFPQHRVAGVKSTVIDGIPCSAELHALFQLADKNNGRAEFQKVAFCSSDGRILPLGGNALQAMKDAKFPLTYPLPGSGS